MRFSNPLVEGTLIRREKRFLAYVQLLSGKTVVAHCPNPGSMKGNAQNGAKVWLEDFGPEHLTKLRKKLRYKWLFVESHGVKVCVDTSLGNPLVAEALPELPEFAGYEEVIPEYTVGDSRFDFLLRKGNEECFVEVKSVSMGEGKKGLFPDSVTVRGQKHVKGLTELVGMNKRAVLFFLNMRVGGIEVSTAKEIDPDYDRFLRDGMRKGLEVLSYSISWKGDEVNLAGKGKFL